MFFITAMHYLVDLATVLAAITNLLMEYESGLKIKKIQALLLSTDGIDLETFSITKGYKNVLMFLDDQIPYIKIRWQGIPHKCVAQLPKGIGTKIQFYFNKIDINKINKILFYI